MFLSFLCCVRSHPRLQDFFKNLPFPPTINLLQVANEDKIVNAFLTNTRRIRVHLRKQVPNLLININPSHAAHVILLTLLKRNRWFHYKRTRGEERRRRTVKKNMMKCILIFSSLIAICAGQCEPRFDVYLSCIKGKLDNNYGALEAELLSDYNRLADKCLATTRE